MNVWNECSTYIDKDDFFQLLYGFQLFSSGEKLLKIDGLGRNRSKIDLLKGGVDGFSCFSLIFSYFIF